MKLHPSDPFYRRYDSLQRLLVQIVNGSLAAPDNDALDVYVSDIEQEMVGVHYIWNAIRDQRFRDEIKAEIKLHEARTDKESRESAFGDFIGSMFI